MSGLTIRLPDGSEVDVPTDDPQVATAAARKHWERLQATPSAPTAPQPRTAAQTAGDFVGDVVDNFLPNWGDEVAAIPDAAKALVTGKPVGEAFDQGRKDFKDHQAQYDTEHPWLSWASTLGGLGASLALPAGRVAEGASLGAKALHGAAVGAGYGAVSGAGEGDTLSSRFNNATTGAAIGGTVGAAATPVLSGLAAGGRYARQALPGVDAVSRRLRNVPRGVLRSWRKATAESDAAERAGRFLNTRMNQGHIATGFGQEGAAATPATLFAEVERRQAMGVPAILGDVTEAMRGTTSWASRGDGPGQRMVKAALDRRKRTEALRVRQHVADEMGPLTDPIRQAEEMRRASRSEAAPMYAEAYAQPMVLTPEIAAISRTPAFNDALPQAVRNIRNAQRDPEAMGFIMRGDGSVDPQSHQFLSTEAFDQVIRAMRDNAEGAMRPASFPGGRPTNTTNSVHINARAGDLRSELAAQNGAYRDVTRMYADDAAQIDALRDGTEFAGLTGLELRQLQRQMPNNALTAWSLGARSAMGQGAADFGAKYPTGDTAAYVRKMLGDDSKQTALADMMDDPEAIRGLQDRLEAEHQGNILWKEVQGNSKTAQRQQADKDMDSALGFMQIPSMSPIGLATRAANLMQAGVSRGMREDVKARIAHILTEQDPDRLRALIDDIAEVAQRDRDFADRLHRTGLAGTKTIAANGYIPEPSKHSSNPEDWRITEDGYVESPDGTMGYKLNDAP